MPNAGHKPLAFLTSDRIRNPPLSERARHEFGYYLREVQRGRIPPFPISRPMGSIGPGVHELRLSDEAGEWRLVYHVGARSVRVLDLFKKTSQRTPKKVLDRCRRRLAANPEPPPPPEPPPG